MLCRIHIPTEEPPPEKPQLRRYISKTGEIHEMVIALTHVEHKNDKKVNNLPFRALRVRPVKKQVLHKI